MQPAASGIFIPKDQQYILCLRVARCVLQSRNGVSLPPDLPKQIEEIPQTEGKSVSAVVYDALLLAHREYLKRQCAGIQGSGATRRVRKAFGLRKVCVGISAIAGRFDTNIFVSAFVFPEGGRMARSEECPPAGTG